MEANMIATEIIVGPRVSAILESWRQRCDLFTIGLGNQVPYFLNILPARTWHGNGATRGAAGFYSGSDSFGLYKNFRGPS
jgi:hypothetical protein